MLSRGPTEASGADSTPADRISICIVAHFAYGALAGGSTGHIGGVERQTSLMARWLAARGHRVSFVTWDEGQADGTEIHGVRVLTLCRRDEGVRGLRFLHPRWTSLNAAMSRANADVYYQNCGEYVTGQVALWCRRHRRKFTYSLAHDRECQPDLRGIQTRRERVLYRYGLGHADLVIAQTQTQQRRLLEGFGRESVVVPMPCPEPDGIASGLPQPPTGASARVLWLGRICEVKRPDRFLDLAEASPDLKFDLVGPEDGTSYSHEILSRASRIPNVTVCGPAGRDEVHRFYRAAACLCCTSDEEGFPNTFLEAWSYGLPVVSTVDPDCVIEDRELGAVGSTLHELAANISQLLATPSQWRRISANARQYYLDTHTVDRVMVRFERLFLDAAREGRRNAIGRSTAAAEVTRAERRTAR